MAKTVTYYYPNEDNPSSMKVFQDRGSQIRGFYFKRDYLKEISLEVYANNYAVYFLFSDDSQDSLEKIYIGQSKQGAGRINNHFNNKDFWNYCIMFVSDNNVFDANAIDYMEYYFIDLMKKSSLYTMDNKAMRKDEPNLSNFDKTTYLSYIKQIEFLLKAEGINLIENEKKVWSKYYEPKRKNYLARIYFQDGNFIVEKDSIILRPKPKLKTWSDNGKLYEKLNERIDQLLSDSKLESIDQVTYRTLVKIPFSSVSGAAQFISGSAQNGWTFFEGVIEVKHG